MTTESWLLMINYTDLAGDQNPKKQVKETSTFLQERRERERRRLRKPELK